MSTTSRFVWNTSHVVDVRDAVFAARTYLEHRDLRSLLSSALASRRVDRACELGCGFGRMTPVLSEFAEAVCGFEREPHFVAEAQLLFPTISFIQVGTLSAIPAPDRSFSLVLTFTVLQHLVDSEVATVALEINRILRPGGLLVLCEETNPSHQAGICDAAGMCTIGRPVTAYRGLFPAYSLLATRPRVIEPTYPRADVGSYMLFEKPRDA